MTDCRMFESHASFAKDYLDAAVDALFGGDSKEASQCLNWAEEKLAAMRKELGPVGF